MSRAGGLDATSSDGDGYWEGYSNYKSVASAIAETIDEALEAYAKLDSIDKEDVKLSRDEDKLVAESRAKIKLAALKLVPELREDAPTNEQYQQILARWHGSVEVETDTGSLKKVQPSFPNEGPEAGYFEALDSIRLKDGCPDWLENWVIDIRTAGWELGYLKAGRRRKDRSDLDPDTEQARQMFE